jgi:hypothetical protein
VLPGRPHHLSAALSRSRACGPYFLGPLPGFFSAAAFLLFSCSVVAFFFALARISLKITIYFVFYFAFISRGASQYFVFYFNISREFRDISREICEICEILRSMTAA